MREHKIKGASLKNVLIAIYDIAREQFDDEVSFYNEVAKRLQLRNIKKISEVKNENR